MNLTQCNLTKLAKCIYIKHEHTYNFLKILIKKMLFKKQFAL